MQSGTLPPVTGTAPLQRTVLFSDVIRSTELIDHHGDLAWLEMVDRHTRAVSAAATAHAGTISTFMGDGFMLLFDRPADAMACALRLQRDAASHGLLGLRIGIDHGDVYTFRGEWWVGLTIHIASRLTDLSRDGGVALSDRCARELHDALPDDSVETRLVAIRGVTEPCLVHLVDPGSVESQRRGSTRCATGRDPDREPRAVDHPEPAGQHGRRAGVG